LATIRRSAALDWYHQSHFCRNNQRVYPERDPDESRPETSEDQWEKRVENRVSATRSCQRNARLLPFLARTHCLNPRLTDQQHRTQYMAAHFFGGGS
jgi:hypothetical protein